MNPVAYTYDWGLTTDISRINASKICGQLGVEHIIRAANIEKKRKYIRLNIENWLKRPKLGMLPIVQAGDKSFIDYGRIISKELKTNLVIHFTGYQLEQREFFIGFTGINQKLKNNQRMTSDAGAVLHARHDADDYSSFRDVEVTSRHGLTKLSGVSISES